MYKTLSKIQKELFLSISGKEYIENNLRGEFLTDRPYNNDEYDLSPWIFTFFFEQKTGYLICEIVHRLTNNRIYGWDSNGNELDVQITTKYFKNHF